MEDIKLISSSHSMKELRSLFSDAYKSDKEIIKFGSNYVSKGVLSFLSSLYVENEFEVSSSSSKYNFKEQANIYSTLDKSGGLDPIMISDNSDVKKNLKNNPLKILDEYVTPSTQALSILSESKSPRFLSGSHYDDFPEILGNMAEAKKRGRDLDLVMFPYGWNKKKDITKTRIDDGLGEAISGEETPMYLFDLSGNVSPSIETCHIESFKESKEKDGINEITATENEYSIKRNMRDEKLSIRCTFAETGSNIWTAKNR